MAAAAARAGAKPAGAAAAPASSLQARGAAAEANRATIAARKPWLGVVLFGPHQSGKSSLLGVLLCALDAASSGRGESAGARVAREVARHDGSGWGELVRAQGGRRRGSREHGPDVVAGMTCRFDTDRFRCQAVDAPGLETVTLNMAVCLSQADVGLLVVSAAGNDFERALDGNGRDGALRDQCVLAYALGLRHIIVCVNRMDETGSSSVGGGGGGRASGWDAARYHHIVKTMSALLTRCGFTCPPAPVDDSGGTGAGDVKAAAPAASAAAGGRTPPAKNAATVTFVPVSARRCHNVTRDVALPAVAAAWYRGPTLVQAIDTCDHSSHSASETATKRFRDLCRAPLRLPCRNAYKIGGIGYVVSGRVLSGTLYDSGVTPTRSTAHADASAAAAFDVQCDGSGSALLPAPGFAPGRVVLTSSALLPYTARLDDPLTKVPHLVRSLELQYESIKYATVGQLPGVCVRPFDVKRDVPRGLRFGGRVLGHALHDPPQYCSSFVAQVVVTHVAHTIERGRTSVCVAHTARAPVEWTRFIRLIDRKTGAVIKPPPHLSRADQRKLRTEQNPNHFEHCAKASAALPMASFRPPRIAAADCGVGGGDGDAHADAAADEVNRKADDADDGGEEALPAAPGGFPGAAVAVAAAPAKPKPTPGAAGAAAAAAATPPPVPLLPHAALHRAASDADATEWAPTQLYQGQSAWVTFTPLSFVSRAREAVRRQAFADAHNPYTQQARQRAAALAARVARTAGKPPPTRAALRPVDTRGTHKKRFNRSVRGGGQGMIVVEPFALYPALGRIALLGGGDGTARHHRVTAVGVVKAVQRCDYDGNPTDFVCGFRDWLTFVVASGHTSGSSTSSGAASSLGAGAAAAAAVAAAVTVGPAYGGIDVLPLDVLRVVHAFHCGVTVAERY